MEISEFFLGNLATLALFFHKHPFYETHWILLCCQVAKKFQNIQCCLCQQEFVLAAKFEQ
jgi:hypothetical protein